MKSLCRSIIEDGAYDVISRYSGKTELVAMVTRECVALIDKLAGSEAAEFVRSNGLALMHKRVSPNIVSELQLRLEERIKPFMLRLTRDFSQEILGLRDDFYLDLKVIARIKFPFIEARKSTFTYQDYTNLQGRKSSAKPLEMTAGYHANLPFPAWKHGPHYDSWFGHSYDGINLWWGIDGVTEETGMTFYPDMVGQEPLPTLEEPPYLERDVPIPKPIFFNLDPGDVIVFNSDTLHGTRVNQADLTRISLSTRINPEKPRFNMRSFRHVQFWVKAHDVDAMLQKAVPTGEQSHRVEKCSFDAKSNPHIYVAKQEDPGNCHGACGDTCRKTVHIEMKSVEVNLPFGKDARIRVCDSTSIPLGGKMLVKCGGQQIVIARTANGLRALSAVCPHLGYSLGAGGHDDQQVFCPGHGLAFQWENGKSGCPVFKARTYVLEEVDGGIFLVNHPREPEEAHAEGSIPAASNIP